MKRTMITLTAISICLVVGPAVAQQKQQVSFKTPASNSKYTQQQILDVGDRPGHQVRLFEIHRTYPSDAPMINGMKLKEQWTRGISDYENGTGTNVNYGEFVLENGDKFFTRMTTVGQDSGGKQTNMSSGTIVGGTGKLSGIQGVVKSSGSSDMKAGVNENQTTIEYMLK
jgi:hypothetical protein